MATVTPSRGLYGTPAHNLRTIPEGPIRDFSAIIEETPVEEWQKRINAFQHVVSLIPEGSAYAEGVAWYNTPALLRHLSLSVSELLKDARSSVVKRTCANLTELFNKCQTDARYLFKDIMHTILSVHAQTVQVIRQAVQNMVLEAIPEVPCKMVMPLWMERLKVDKSRTVRDACAIYLGQALESWTEEGYLTQEIWMQVGHTLVRTLRDPSPNVRNHAKEALEHMRTSQPSYWETLINDPDGPAAKDVKLQQWLHSRGTGDDAAEELSVASKFSYNSDTRFATRGMATYRMASPRQRGYPSTPSRASDMVDAGVPKSIAVTTPPEARNPRRAPTAGGGLGPPLRRPFHHAGVDSTPQQQGTPPRPPPPASLRPAALEPIHDNSASHNDDEVAQAAAESPKFPTNLSGSFLKTDKQARSSPTTTALTAKALERVAELRSSRSAELDSAASSPSFEGPFIANMKKLKEHASKRRSRYSLLMQERFRISSSNLAENEGDLQQVAEEPKQEVTGKLSEEENQVPPTSPQAPEHMVIAVRLLRAHKDHVDCIMETLKLEMEALRDFDGMLEEAGRPTEEEVLDYFESVGLCLEQRTRATNQLQHELDRISRGEPPEEE